MKKRTNHLLAAQTPRRGFASIFAISLIILVGAALVVLSAYFAMDASRTRAGQQEAQLRQLLTAGAVAAVARADDPRETKLQLPTELGDAKVSIRPVSGSGEERSVVVVAKVGAREMSQVLKLHRGQDRWNVTAATLAGEAQPPTATQPSERSTAASQRS